MSRRTFFTRAQGRTGYASAMRTVDTHHDAIAERVRDCLRRRGLELSAWYVCDEIETLVWYECRDLTEADLMRATHDAKLAALAGLVRDDLTPDEYSALIDVLPLNLHGIFMRSAPQRLQRSW